MNTEKVNDEIKDVIERNIDAYKGYNKAADKVRNPQLAEAFRQEAQQRRTFAAQLENATHAYQNAYNKDINEVAEDGSFEGNLHRTWMDIKTAFSSDKDESVVEECIRGEKNALEEYDELLNKQRVTPDSQGLIRSQREEVRNAISKLEQLETRLD